MFIIITVQLNDSRDHFGMWLNVIEIECDTLL